MTEVPLFGGVKVSFPPELFKALVLGEFAPELKALDEVLEQYQIKKDEAANKAWDKIKPGLDVTAINQNVKDQAQNQINEVSSYKWQPEVVPAIDPAKLTPEQEASNLFPN